MKNNQTVWLHPNQLYIVSGGASANSFFFENRQCHIIFFEYFDCFLSNMVDLLHYKMTPTGWVMAIKTKSEKEIIAAYLMQRRKSQKADRTKDLDEPKRMISEHFRIFLSNYVKMSNYYLGREGVLVKKRFDKYQISNEEEYYREFELICDLQACNYRQIKKKYQADENNYDEANELGDKEDCIHSLRSSVGLYTGNLKMVEMPVKVRLVRPFSDLPAERMSSILKADVLRKILHPSQNDQNQPNPYPKRE